MRLSRRTASRGSQIEVVCGKGGTSKIGKTGFRGSVRCGGMSTEKLAKKSAIHHGEYVRKVASTFVHGGRAGGKEAGWEGSN